MPKFEWLILHKRYAAVQCWNRNSTPNNTHFIRMSILGDEEEVLCFKDIFEMTIENVLYMVRYLKNIYKDNLYVLDEYGTELEDPRGVVQHGRSYRGKRKQAYIIKVILN